MTSTTYTYTDLDTTFDTLAQAKAYAVTALGMAIESYEKEFAWVASGYSVLGDLSFYREDSGGWSVRIRRDGDTLKIEDEPAPTDAAPVTEQPAPTFAELRAATDAASAVELAAHNALVQAENAYCYAAGLDGDDRREWANVAARFGRTKAGQALHAALAEARQVLREAVRVDTEACRKTWVNGFGALNTPAEQPAPVDLSSLALDPVTDDYQEGYSDGIEGLPIQPNRFGLYNAGYVDGQADALSTDAYSEITRLNRIITDLQADLHACEIGRKATEEAWAGNDEAARAEIGQLRGDLFAERNAHAETTKALREILGGDPITEVKYDADYSMPWVCIVRKMEQSAKFYCSSREGAEQQATQTAAALRHKNKQTRR